MNSSDNSSAVIRVDLHNADSEGFVRLNTVGAIEDLSRYRVILSEGLEIRVTDGEILLVGTVHKPGSEGQWRVEVDWKEVFRLHAARS